MAAPNGTWPLMALDAVVIDTETTALDACKARIVEIAAVPISGGNLEPEAAFRRHIQAGYRNSV
jgi:CBS domain-containing protein